MSIGSKVYYEEKDIIFPELKRMIEDGELIPQPDFQRGEVYKPSQSSKVIESALLGIPIPPVYLCQEEDNTLSVIDGQQRIMSIKKFLSNDYKLTQLDELKDLNNKYYKDIPKETQLLIKQKSLKAILILKESNSLKYDIFARLNKGAMQLNAQELRNCIYRGPFNDMIENLAKNNKMVQRMFISQNHRKSYQERILRFFALRNYIDYKGSLSKTMNEYMEKNRDLQPKELKALEKLFTGSLDLISQVLGDKAFTTISHESNQLIEGKFSATVYDSIIIPFSFYEKHDLMSYADEIRNRIELLRTDLKYKDDLYGATGSRSRVLGRINKVYSLLQEITKSFGNDDGKRLFSNEDKKKLFKKGYICSYCGNEILSIEDAEVDHCLAYSQGGKTDLSNAQLLHRHCNRVKSDSEYNETLDENEASDD